MEQKMDSTTFSQDTQQQMDFVFGFGYKILDKLNYKIYHEQDKFDFDDVTMF